MDDSLEGESSEEDAGAPAEPDALHKALQSKQVRLLLFTKSASCRELRWWCKACVVHCWRCVPSGAAHFLNTCHSKKPAHTMPLPQVEADGYILTAARTIAPHLYPGSWARGFEWCREQLAAAGYATLASEVQLARANEHLAQREYAAAVGLLKEFEQADSKQRARAAVNLSTLHLLEGQLEAAGGYAEYCCEADPHSMAALVSAGNVHLARGEAEAALQVGAVHACGAAGLDEIAGVGQEGFRTQVPSPCPPFHYFLVMSGPTTWKLSRAEPPPLCSCASMPLQLYEDALQVEPGCLQAQYNAGLACRALGLHDRALALMQQLLHEAPGHAEAMWQVGSGWAAKLRGAVRWA